MTTRKVGLVLSLEDLKAMRSLFVGITNPKQERCKLILNNARLLDMPKINKRISNLEEYTFVGDSNSAIAEMNDGEFCKYLLKMVNRCYKQDVVPSYENITSKSRKEEYVSVRVILGYHLQEAFGWSSGRTGQALGDRAHSSALYYKNKLYPDFLSVDKKWQKMHKDLGVKINRILEITK